MQKRRAFLTMLAALVRGVGAGFASAGSLCDRQRADVVESSLQNLREAASGTDDQAIRLLGQFKTGCPALPAL
jgi:hypothetical protein